jgi:hypothetical protein
MSKGGKVVVGIFTFLPVLLLILFFYNLFSTMVHYAPEIERQQFTKPDAKEVLEAIAPIFMYIILLSINCLGLLIYYIIHAVNNKNLESNERVLWVLLFVFVGFIAFPVYFFAKIVKTPPAATVV